MRELKFRVYDRLAERFIKCDEGYQGHYVLSLKGEFHNLQNGSGGKEYVVQQYTGLLDKNGKDIYEGDILIFRPSYDESLGGQFGNAVFSASFKDGSFRFGDEFADQDGANYYEIIGNIFENSELLK
jgi:uncharacterized phage protein (TIGR01671 family)